jgi:hypothetical protein
MDATRFDAVVKAFGAGMLTRRSLTVGLIGGGLATLGAGRSAITARKRRRRCRNGRAACDTSCGGRKECVPDLIQAHRICCCPKSIFAADGDPDDVACCPTSHISFHPSDRALDVCCPPPDYVPGSDGTCCPTEAACGDQCCGTFEVCSCGACVDEYPPCPPGCCTGETCLPLGFSDGVGDLVCCPPERVCGATCCAPGLVCIGDPPACRNGHRTIRIRRGV